MSETNSQDQQLHSQSPSGGGSPHYWCHHCGREVPIYMAPDPTCQLCNEQFIEEIDDVGDDPRAFFGGGTNMGGENNNDGPSGEDDIFQFFRGAGGGGTTGARFQFTTEDLNQQGGEGGNPMGAMLQSVLSNILSGGGAAAGTATGTGTGAGNNNNSNTSSSNSNINNENNNNRQTGQGDTDTGDGSGGEGGNPLGAMLQNVFSNVLSGGGGSGGSNGSNTNEQTSEGNNSGGENGGQQQQQQQRRTPMIFYSGLVDGNMQFRPINLQGNTGDGQGQAGENGSGANAFFQMGGAQTDGNEAGGDGDGEGRNAPGNNLQGFLQLISALTGTPMDAGLVGNPNDYVFSQGALDNIITQLMEQTGGRTAPPPAPEDVIDGLPKRTLTEQEFKDQVDCAVCKDEFNQAESVIELPCQHLFHDDCIKPWLKVNGTCPVCRHSVLPISSTEGDDTGNGNDNDSNNNNNNNSNTSPQQQQQQRNTAQSSTSDATNPSDQSTTTSNTWGQAQFSSGPISWSAATPYSTSGSSSWPTHIPGAFTWGPGNSSSNNNNTNSRSQQEENNNTSPDMDLDLD